MHGRETIDRVAEFGEQIMWYVPVARRSKMDLRWRYGIFLGRALHTDHNYIGLYDGSITTARAITRVTEDIRWDFAAVNRICGSMLDMVKTHDSAEEESIPHQHPPRTNLHSPRIQIQRH